MTIVGLYDVSRRYVPPVQATSHLRPVPPQAGAVDGPRVDRHRRRRTAGSHVLVAHEAESVAALHALQRTLMRVVLQQGGVDDVVRAAAPLLEACLVVVGADGQEIGRCGRDPLRAVDGSDRAPQPGRGLDVEAVVRALDDLLPNAGRPPVWEMTRDPGSERRVWVASLDAGEDRLGWLLASTDDGRDLDLSVIERVAEGTALVLFHQRSLALVETEVRGELLEDLLSAAPGDPESLQRRAALVPLHLERPHTVLVADARHVPRTALAALDAELTRTLRGCHGWYDEHLVILVPVGNDDQVVAGVSSLLLRLAGLPIALGTAGPTASVTDFARCYQEAVRYLKAHEVLGRAGGVASKSTLGLYGLIAGAADPALFDAFLTGTVGPLLAYDRDRGTDLVHTLRTYLTEGSNHTRTAQVLCIHPNTLYRRLDRITELLGDDWRQHDRSLEIHVALRFEDMVRPELVGRTSSTA